MKKGSNLGAGIEISCFTNFTTLLLDWLCRECEELHAILMFSLKPPNVAELLLAQFPVGEDSVGPGRGQTLVVKPQSWQQGDAQPGPALRSLPQPLQQVVSLARPLHLSRQENINLEDIKSVMKGQSLSCVTRGNIFRSLGHLG